MSGSWLSTSKLRRRCARIGDYFTSLFFFIRDLLSFKTLIKILTRKQSCTKTCFPISSNKWAASCNYAHIQQQRQHAGFLFARWRTKDFGDCFWVKTHTQQQRQHAGFLFARWITKEFDNIILAWLISSFFPSVLPENDSKTSFLILQVDRIFTTFTGV